jgi:multiple antibiotic resistance protein
MSMHEMAQAFLLVYAGLVSIVNPLGSAPIFLALTANHTERVRHDLARRVAVNGFVRVAGGLAVASFGWRLLRDGVEPTNTAGNVTQGGPDSAFYPLTMPLTVGPGSISVAVTLGAQRPQDIESVGRLAQLIVGAVAGLAAIAASVFFCYRFADRMVAVLGPSGINVLIRLAEFILLCIGIQIIWSGYSALIGAPAS